MEKKIKAILKYLAEVLDFCMSEIPREVRHFFMDIIWEIIKLRKLACGSN